MTKVPTILNEQMGTIVLYRDDADKVRVSALLKDETLWMTQAQIAALLDVNTQAVTKHIKNIYEDGELVEAATCSKMEQVRREGNRTVNRKVAFYNLDMVIAVGYRVNSKKATAFRIWATNILREYIIKGFAMDDERLKNPDYFLGEDYFDEMLERIKDIRSSERRFYQQITDIYSQCSVDYDKNSPITRRFFAQVQNELHWAISKKTAAEIIYSRADHKKPNMGLTTWKYGPDGRIYQSDVLIAKNYLNKEELSHLNRLVDMYLDYAENQAKKKIPMTMADWAARLDAFLRFNEEELLTDEGGKVSRAIAEAFAIQEYQLYRKELLKNSRSDFDLFVMAAEKKRDDSSLA